MEAKVPSRQLGTESRTSRLAIASVSTVAWASGSRPVDTSAWSRKERSKRRLWPTSTAPPTNSRNEGSISPARGASDTIASLMPVSAVMNGGIRWSGRTKVWYVASSSPPRNRAAATSVSDAVAGDPPVVSTSTTTKVTWLRGVPSSSEDRCAAMLIGTQCSERVFGFRGPGGLFADGYRGAMGATASTRYRCAACGNLTRFDVVTGRRTKAFHHYSVGGDLAVEEEEVLEERIESVSCRWCGNGGAVETIESAPSTAG